MNILWCGAYSAATGYGNQSRLFAPRIQALGHKVAVLEIGNSYRTPYELDGIKVFPCHHDPLLNDVVAGYVTELEIDAAITLCDVWRFDKRIWGKFPTFSWTPIDHQPVPPAVADFLHGITRPIAMSQFGVDEMRKIGIDPLYMPHAFDPAIFYPQDKAEARKAIGLDPDAFIAAFIGVNDSVPSRKGIPELLAAWKFFNAEHPETRLYLHTVMDGNLALGTTQGVRIDALIQTLGINPASIYMPNQQTIKGYIPPSQIARLYNAADVLVQPSRGEGFGLPVLEAQACGTPVITTNFAAAPNHVHAGWLCEGEMDWSWQNSFMLKPGIRSIVEALEEAYAARGDSRIRNAALEGSKRYTIDYVFETYTKRVLAAMAESVLGAYADSIRRKISA